MTEAPRPLVIIGAGGLGSEVLWAAQNMNVVKSCFDVRGFCDDDSSRRGTSFCGLPVLGSMEEFDGETAVKPVFVCGVGRNAVRSQLVERALALGWEPATVIDTSVIVAPGAVVGAGTYVAAGVILSPNSTTGSHVIINHLCTVGHDSVLEDFVQLSPGARVSGNCHLKQGALLGSNAVVAPGKTIGRNAVVGACSFALRNVGDGDTVVGNPARVTSHTGT